MWQQTQGQWRDREGAQIRTFCYGVNWQSGTQTVTYLTRDLRAIPQVGSAHHTISALCGVLVHIFLMGLESGCHCNKMMVSFGNVDSLRSLSCTKCWANYFNKTLPLKMRSCSYIKPIGSFCSSWIISKLSRFHSITWQQTFRPRGSKMIFLAVNSSYCTHS